MSKSSVASKIASKLAGKSAGMAEADALKILEKYNDVDVATKLVGPERAEYLKALDIVHGDRATRAKNLGFGDRTWYHGTNADIKEFDKARLGEKTKAPSAKQAFFFASNPEVSKEYTTLRDNDVYKLVDDYRSQNSPEFAKAKQLKAEQAEIQAAVDAHPFYKDKDILQRLFVPENELPEDLLALEKSLTEKSINSQNEFRSAEKLAKSKYSKLEKDPTLGANIGAYKLKTEKPYEHDYNFSTEREVTYNDILKDVTAEGGNDSVVLKNTFDPHLTDIATVFEPEQIRSTNAAFDPRFKKSGNVLAGLTGLGVVGATLGGNNNAEASQSSVASKIASKISKPKNANALETLERLLPSNSNDAARATLRSNPEAYKEYLQALDAQYGARNERAKSLGFSDETFYHGTTHDNPIEKFKSNKVKSGQLYGRGTYVTPDPEMAEIYTQKLDQHSGTPLTDESGSIYPLKIRAGKSFDVKEYNGDDFEKIKQQLGIKGDPSPKYIGSREGVTPTNYSKALVDNGYNSVKDEDLVNVINSRDLRSTNAAFDPRFKDSADILALAGNQAPKIVGKMLKPHMNLGDAFSSITEPINKIDEPVNKAVDWVSKNVAEQTNFVPQAARSPTTEYAENFKSNVLDNALGFAAPTPSSILMGKTLPLLKAAKGAQIAERMIVPPKSAAVVYQEIRAADKAAKYGNTILIDNSKPVSNGTVKVIDTVKPGLGKVKVVD